MQHTRHGYWIAEAGMPPARPPLQGEIEADLVVAGGGYTGMWAAWHAKRLDPGARIAILEAEVCGCGPSGRNGGFVNAMWFSVARLVAAYGDEAGLEIADAAEDSVRRIGRFCDKSGIDAWYRLAGYLHTSTAPAQDRAWSASVRESRRLGRASAARELDRAETTARCASPIFRKGCLYETGATIQPARLAFGLRERLLEAGVEIYEGTRLERLAADGDGGVVAHSRDGKVRAGAAVLAIGGAAAGWPRLRTRLTLTSSHIVATEPVPDVIEELGWHGGESVTDSRAMIHYFRTTPDQRIIFGWGGGRIVRGAATGGRAEMDPEIVRQISRHLVRFFPALEGRRIDHAWGGPIDASPLHLPQVLTIGAGRVHSAFGYTGNGVGPSQLVGRSLASLALGRTDWAARLAYVNPSHPGRVPPEPLRFIGGTLIRNALVRKETAEEKGSAPGRVTRLIAGIPERIGFHIGR